MNRSFIQVQETDCNLLKNIYFSSHKYSGKPFTNGLAQFACGLCNSPLHGLQINSGSLMCFIFCWDIQKPEHYPKVSHVHKEYRGGHQYYSTFAHCNESLFLWDAWEQSDAHQTFAPFIRKLLMLSVGTENNQSTFLRCLERNLAQKYWMETPKMKENRKY